MKLTNLQELYVEELRDLFDFENQITKALPKMEAAATSPKLKKGFHEHLIQTDKHVSRLLKIFEEMDLQPEGKHCVGMAGIIAEGSELIKSKPAPEVLDAGLISAAQHVEHYEMAGYGTCIAYADLLGNKSAASLLQQTLEEEVATDKKLTDLAQKEINVAAK